MLKTALKHCLVLSAFLLALASTTIELWAQRGGPPRRIANPETIHLPGGGRVEFKHFDSLALGQKLEYSVFLPPSYDGESNRRYPTLYFLHGLFNDHTSWAVERYGNLPGQIEQLMAEGKVPEFVIIHPAGERGLYTDSVEGNGRYETAIYRDLVSQTEKTYRVIPERSARALAGTSMGGYGALKIAMKHPEVFATAVAGSPIVFLGDDPLNSIPDGSNFSGFLEQLVASVFGNPVDKKHWKANSLEEIALKGDFKGLNIYFFYGTADRYGQFIPLEQGVRRLDQILSERSIAHTFEIIEDGAHGWELVRDNLAKMAEFAAQTF